MIRRRRIPPAPPVHGTVAPGPRPTLAGAAWLATLAALPVGAVLLVAEALWRWLGS